MKCVNPKFFFPCLLALLMGSFSFVSCVKMVEVEVEKPIYISGTTSAVSKVLHFQQTVDAKSYALVESEDKDVAAHSKVADIAKNYEGFSASALSQNGATAYVFYDRNVITHTFYSGTSGAFEDGSASKVVKGLYGATYSKPEIPTSGEFRFTKWESSENALPNWTFGTSDENYYAQWIDKSVIGDDFAYITGTKIKGNEEWILTPASQLFTSGTEFEIKDFVMCKHEVTRGEFENLWAVYKDDEKYKALYPNGINTAPTSGDAMKNPVSTITWYASLVYCNLRSMNENMTPYYSINGSTDPADWGVLPTTVNSATWDSVNFNESADGYRLPTEAEWEYAARAKSTYVYSGSDDYKAVGVIGGGTTKEVCSLAENGFEIYDMSGNVWEYCQEKGTDQTKRVLRGGSWQTDITKCGVGVIKANCSRHEVEPFKVQNNFGLRVVRNAN